MSSSSWQQETETLRQAIIGMAEGSDEKRQQEQAFAQRNASHALEQLAKNNSSKFTVIDPKKRPPKLTKKEQRKKDAEEYARAKRQRKAEEEDEEELREEEELLLSKEEREVERYDGMIRVLTANKDQELRMVESAEKELADFTALEASTRADLERFERSTDPALKCYFSAMRQLKNIVDYPGYVRDDKNEILLELRASYDKFQAKYAVPWEAYEWGHKAKTTSHTMAAMNKRQSLERLALHACRMSNTDRELARVAEQRAAAAAAPRP